jgi:hypothetical protein
MPKKGKELTIAVKREQTVPAIVTPKKDVSCRSRREQYEQAGA